MPGFDVVFANYTAEVEKCIERMGGHRGFRLDDDDMRHLLEAYALGDAAMKGGSLLETSPWGRQVGATAVAIALYASVPNARIVKHSLAAAKNTKRRIRDAFASERLKPSKLNNVWAMPSLRSDMRGQRPDLVVFDSDAMWAPNIQEEIEDAHRLLNCGVLVFKSKLR